MVDMSCTLLHHGHIRLLKKAAELGKVIVALTIDEEILKIKGYTPELNFMERKEILLAMKYVSDVIPSMWLITDEFIIKNKIDVLVHGSDNKNELKACETKIFERTPGVSSEIIRSRVSRVMQARNK